MLVNVIKSYRIVVAVWDEELLGKKFESETAQLDVKESFYKGEEKSFEETIELMKSLSREDATFNIVGEKSVAAAIESGIIGKENVDSVAGIPYVLILI